MSRYALAMSMCLSLGWPAWAGAETWFLPDVFPNHHLAATYKLAGVETIGSGRPVFWVPTLESSYWTTGNWTRTLTQADERPCCWDFNQWHADGDRGRGSYVGYPGSDTYDTWTGEQGVATFPLVVETDALPMTRVIPAGSLTGLRGRRSTDTVVGYLDRSGNCCHTAPVAIAGHPVLVRISMDYVAVPGQPVLKIEGWGVDEAGRRTSSGEAFYFCHGCLSVGDATADGPVRWEVTAPEGHVLQRWTFDRWVPRTAADVVDTMRPELDHLRRQVKTLEADKAALLEELSTCAP